MITYVNGSIFEQPVEAMVNPVNCVGVMGSGLALEFKNRFPALYEDYVDKCKNKMLKPGSPCLFQNQSVKIVNFPTKAHWRFPSRLKWIDEGLARLRLLCESNSIHSIALPALGCGRGKLAWDDVRRLIENHLADAPFEVIICLDKSSLAPSS